MHKLLHRKMLMQRCVEIICQDAKELYMKKINPATWTYALVILYTLFFLPGCSKDAKTKTYSIVEPVYKAKSAVFAEINGNNSEAVVTAGKIYIKDNFIFLNDIDKGIHIINNTDPSHPVQTAFLNIPGNQDMAVKGNTLYADMYGDLLAIDITDVHHVTVSNHLNNLFTERVTVNGFDVDSNEVIVDWITKDTTVNVDEGTPFNPQCLACGLDFIRAAAESRSGVAGSMAKMVLINDYLYTIAERHSIGVINTKNAKAPYLASSMFAGFDLETIYPFEDKLFLGSATGMFMYDISDPESPVALGQFQHGRACDPVVTDGNYAYVTLHAGTECGGDANELDLVNIQDLMQPALVKSYPMTKPTGLCKDGKLLFVCDSTAVKLYDATNASDLHPLKEISTSQPYDIIAFNKKALVIAKDGLYQYDYGDINNIRLLSFFAVK
jgi:hypothetical protein